MTNICVPHNYVGVLLRSDDPHELGQDQRRACGKYPYIVLYWYAFHCVSLLVPSYIT